MATAAPSVSHYLDVSALRPHCYSYAAITRNSESKTPPLFQLRLQHQQQQHQGEIYHNAISCRTLLSSTANLNRGSSHHHADSEKSKSKSNLLLDNEDKSRSSSQPQHQHHPSPIPDFNDAQSAFERKTNGELIKAMITFGLCQIRPLVRHSERLLKVTRSVLGDRITDGLLKASLFGHFCAGEDEQRIQPTITKLEMAGIGSILDFAAEDDDSSHSAPTQSNPTGNLNNNNKSMQQQQPQSQSLNPNTVSVYESQLNPNVRMYDYESEAKCDRHVETFRQCIQSVSHLQKDGFAAIKVTALGNPKLLARMSRAIVEAQNLFAKFDTNGDGCISEEEFERGLDLFFINNSDATHLLQRVKEIMPAATNDDAGSSGSSGNKVDYITWSMLLAPHDLPNITRGCREVGPLALATPTAEEAELIETMYQRGHALAREAAACGTRLLVDAEQARFQPAIDNLVLELQRTYNAVSASDYPIIYNTYQCYLKDATHRLQADVERSKRYNYHFGAKLVRGAYMESERAMAESLCLPSPIHDTIQDTHECYNAAVQYLLQHSQESSQAVELMCATHNQETIELAIQVMNKLGIDRTARTISFAQLFGMKDNLTYNLGRHGFRAYKYVPYGEVKMVMPYLLRRASENSAITGGASKELKMIVDELSRRVFGGGGGKKRATTGL